MDFNDIFHTRWHNKFESKEDNDNDEDKEPPMLTCLNADYFDNKLDQLESIKEIYKQSELTLLQLRRKLERQEFITNFLKECYLFMDSVPAVSNPFYEDLSEYRAVPLRQNSSLRRAYNDDKRYFEEDNSEDADDHASLGSLEDYLLLDDGSNENLSHEDTGHCTRKMSSNEEFEKNKDACLVCDSKHVATPRRLSNRRSSSFNSTDSVAGVGKSQWMTLTQRLNQAVDNDRSFSMIEVPRSSIKKGGSSESELLFSALYDSIAKTLRQADKNRAQPSTVNTIIEDSSHSAADTKMLLDRLAALRRILEDERSHLEVLRVLQQYQKALESAAVGSETTNYGIIFFRITQLLNSQQQFVVALERRISVESHLASSVLIHDLFSFMATESSLLEYMDNVYRALQACEVACRQDRVFQTYLSHKIPIAQAITSDSKKISQTTHFSIQDLIALPTKWLITHAENMRSLLALTPKSHPDHEHLENGLAQLLNEMGTAASHARSHSNSSSNKLNPLTIDNNRGGDALVMPDNCEEQPASVVGRQLIMQRFLVELSGGRRRLRRVFLFSDLLVVAKDKIGAINESNSGASLGPGLGATSLTNRRKSEENAASRIDLELKWYIPLHNLALHKNNCKDDDYDKESRKTLELVRNLKERIRELRADLHKLRFEVKRHESASSSGDAAAAAPAAAGSGSLGDYDTQDFGFMKRRLPIARRVEKREEELRKLQGELLLASQNRPLNLSWMSPHGVKIEKRFLLGSEPELEEWLQAIRRLHAHASSSSTPPPNIETVRQLLIQHSRGLTINRLGSALMNATVNDAAPGTGLQEEAGLVGFLRVVVHRLEGLENSRGCFVTLELDSLGQFMLVAKTAAAIDSSGVLEQDFELTLDGSETTLRCWVRRRDEFEDVILGRLNLQLEASALHNYKEKMHSISMATNPNEKCLLVLSLRFQERAQTLKRKKNRVAQGLFGTSLSQLQEHNNRQSEADWVPELITSCVRCLEARGLKESGLYRISAASLELQQLCRRLEAMVEGGSSGTLASSSFDRLFQEQDVHLVSNVLKKFFRELTDPLFTAIKYKSFIDTFDLPNETQRRNGMLTLINDLPSPNRATARAILRHLVVVSQHETQNRMSANNLSLIFGPTLLSPPVDASAASYAPEPTAAATSAAVFNGLNLAMKESSVLIYLLKLTAGGVLFPSESERAVHKL